MTFDFILKQIDEQRRQRGFMTVAEMLAQFADTTLLDPFSILISEGVTLGRGNLIYPNVIIERHGQGHVTIGSGNVLFGGALLYAEGALRIGSGNRFGDGGVRIKALPGEQIEIGDGGRYMSGAEITGTCTLGSGTQILGVISVRNCILGAGETFEHPDPDLRGGVLKGFGQARGLRLNQGEVINGRGDFAQSAIERQTVYHPRN